MSIRSVLLIATLAFILIRSAEEKTTIGTTSSDKYTVPYTHTVYNVLCFHPADSATFVAQSM